MKVEQEIGNKYVFKDDEGNAFYSLKFINYPDCCVMGIAHTFMFLNKAKFDEHKEEIQQYVFGLMERFSLNQVMVADVKHGGGYLLVESMKGCIPLNVALNKNTGNYVYTFVVYKER